ncbi:replication initiator protein [Dipodfec virus RodF1_80]|uniref:Replication initiator protein n=1 Tax=Dipodfec virus RodF1_80 TaxID=2929312 RepID=A0A976N313_9VIRU|nr:replication initiator protein [Dipodfec virus RodF1_80]
MSSCIAPFYIKNPNYGTYKDKFGYQYIPVPCGRCEFCLSRKRQQWFFRITQEVASASSAFFITLTYDDAHLPLDGRVCKRDCQLFLKRFREQIRPYRIRYFLVSEYGESFGRPHYHLILFNYPKGRDNLIKELQFAWTLCDPLQFERYGVVGTVQAASINYVCKYCLSTIASDDPTKKTFMLCSKGIGKNFLSPAMVDYLRARVDGLGYVDGRKVPLPRYYADKVFNSQQKMIINRKKTEFHEQDLDECIKDFEQGNRFGGFRIRQQQREEQQRKIRKSLKNG